MRILLTLLVLNLISCTDPEEPITFSDSEELFTFKGEVQVVGYPSDYDSVYSWLNNSDIRVEHIETGEYTFTDSMGHWEIELFDVNKALEYFHFTKEGINPRTKDLSVYSFKPTYMLEPPQYELLNQSVTATTSGIVVAGEYSGSIEGYTLIVCDTSREVSYEIGNSLREMTNVNNPGFSYEILFSYSSFEQLGVRENQICYFKSYPIRYWHLVPQRDTGPFGEYYRTNINRDAVVLDSIIVNY